MKERLSGRSGGYSSGRQVFDCVFVFQLESCLVQDISAPNSVTELDEMLEFNLVQVPCSVQG